MAQEEVPIPELEAHEIKDVLSGNPLLVHEDPETSEMVVTFPVEPCNETACTDYVNALGGCHAICANRYGADHFSGTLKFGVRRRSMVSFWSKWSLTKKLLCTRGKPHKFYNCGCDCKFFEDQTPKRSYLAQYECWTCFGDKGQTLKPAQLSEMKQYNFDDLIALNRRRGVKVHFLGPKQYDFHAPAITRPG